MNDLALEVRSELAAAAARRRDLDLGLTVHLATQAYLCLEGPWIPVSILAPLCVTCGEPIRAQRKTGVRNDVLGMTVEHAHRGCKWPPA